jgi:flagellar biosynthesis/type III secretory pathway protein FliH
VNDQPQPLFAVLAAAQNTRPFATAITTQPTPPVAAPWLLQAQNAASNDDGAAARNAAALAEARAQAIEEGRAEGLRETAALRETLHELAAQLIAARDEKAANAAETIAECAVAAIQGWVATAPKQELFAPVVKAWMERGGAVAGAKVHPSGVAALQAAIGDAPITIEADATLAPGDLKIRGEALDVSHAWGERLRELRDAIATALETA